MYLKCCSGSAAVAGSSKFTHPDVSLGGVADVGGSIRGSILIAWPAVNPFESDGFHVGPQLLAGRALTDRFGVGLLVFSLSRPPGWLVPLRTQVSKVPSASFQFGDTLATVHGYK